MSLNDLKGGLNSYLRDVFQSLPEPRVRTAFSTEIFLASLREYFSESKTTLKGEHLAIIDRLCKKVEVPKRLVIEYTLDLCKTTNSTPVTPEYAILFTLLLCVLALENNDLKFLNCALKISDGCLREPVVILPTEIREFICAISDQLLTVAQ